MQTFASPRFSVGLTGGIASGKSVVGEMFVALGAHLIHADQIAHELMQPGEPVYQEVVRRFGPGILNPDGTISADTCPFLGGLDQNIYGAVTP